MVGVRPNGESWFAVPESRASRRWHPGPSQAFIVEKPVKREIFAACFRDRVVHHALINRLNPFLEKSFIYDSYSCRVGKGTHFGIERVKRFIRQCSGNYTRDAWVLKLDIRGFFMHIQRPKLMGLLERFVASSYPHADQEGLLAVCRTLVMHNPVADCIIRSQPELWDNLPTEKSLFGMANDTGLPIGNLSSQVFANFYLNGLDHFCKHDLGLRYFGRYVDDLVIVHEDKEYLLSIIPRIRGWLHDERGLELHPRKVRLQHYSKGVPFLGVYIMPGRCYPAYRIRANFEQAIYRHNQIVLGGPPDRDDTRLFLSSINSYLGILQHTDSWRYRTDCLKRNLSPWWKRRCIIPMGTRKIMVRG